MHTCTYTIKPVSKGIGKHFPQQFELRTKDYFNYNIHFHLSWDQTQFAKSSNVVTGQNTGTEEGERTVSDTTNGI